MATEAAESEPEDGIDPAAQWPDGWRSMAEADHARPASAELAAHDRKRWVHTKPLTDWEAIRLQHCRGRSQREVAKEFGVSRRSVCDHAADENWGPLTPGELEALSRDVAGAGLARARLLKKKIDRAAIARSAEWRPLGRMRRSQRHVAVELDELGLFKAHPADDPANPDCDWRGRAWAELPTLLEEAKAAGEEQRASVISARMADLSTEALAQAAMEDWSVFARREQLPPEGEWRVWLLMGGRGAGKTRAGAEWVRHLVETGQARRIALVGPTLHDVREVMIEGPSGLRSVAGVGARPKYSVARRRLEWPNGAVAFAFSAEDPESLRGPQFDAAWCDEIGAWAKDWRTWETMLFALRIGPAPRVAATTTPRPRTLVRRLADLAEARRGGVAMTHAPTRANARNLAPGFLAAMEESYAGTTLGRQELEGELVRDPPGAMFTRATIEANRVSAEAVQGMERIVVGVDPPAGSGVRSDACGIVVAGVKAGVVHVLADASARGLRPLAWAQRVVAAARRWSAGVIAAEANQGGEMVEAVLAMAGATPSRGLRVKLKRASASKTDRAQPLSALCEAGKVKWSGVFRELEDEMCSFGAEGASASPDRVDALVWAVAELLDGPGVRPRVRVLEP